MSNLILGDLGVAVSVAAAFAALVAFALGLWRRDRVFLAIGRGLLWAVLAGAALAFAAMERALINRDFTVAYVADNGSSATAPLFNVATAWAALEGSILLWGLVLAGYVVAMSLRFRDRGDDPLVVLAQMCSLLVVLFFFGLMVGPADPFVAFDPPPGYDGPGPNPLLQDNPLMAVHPPMLYLGYVGFTVPFAFAVSSLALGRTDEGWLAETRRWSLFAWGFLTAGIVLGAWWSYDTLGWGGYWAWDPVENASLLPWLTATAYLHSAMVQERRGMLRVWNLSLVCATFSLTILGTFITRSGVLDSVHSFTASGIGPAILAFFGVVAAACVLLIGWRGDRLRAPGRFDSFFSREGTFLANNLLFALFAAVVLLGTVFPLVAEAVSGERLSVGAPYFQRMTMPLGMLLLFLMAAAPVLPWRKASTELLGRRLFWPAWCGVAVLAVAVGLGARGPAPLVAFALGGFAGGAAARQLVLAARRQGWRGLLGRTNGGMVTHIGVVIIAVALAASGSYLQQAELSLREGDAVRFAGQEFGYVGVREVVHPERLEVRAEIAVDGACCAAPAISRYTLRGQVVGHPATLTSARRDVQLSVVRLPSETGGNLVLRITVQPLILWLWVGGAVMLAGIVLAAFPGRRRRPTDPVSAYGATTTGDSEPVLTAGGSP
ncbi:MAG: cytochrome c biogenesis protein CcsA [bacterium]|nr:cytochrome c biogenesis protein CcsA [bacterium]MXV90113.1 heme lyase CcmF/NrfE family subunit [Acidimicrobiia bacterium]MYC45730.1 heme lyase CcmF/NrfE family subunit [Acidimicrobiia bacterium]